MKSKLFEHITLSDAFLLWRTVVSSSSRESELIQQKYERQGKYFDDSLRLLLEAKLLMQVGDKIILGRLNKRQVGSMDASAFGQLLIRSMKKTKTVYRTEIEKYLSKFSMNGDEIQYAPETSARLRESGIRNFLLESGIISSGNGENTYVLKTEFTQLVKIKKERRILSSEQFAETLRRQQETGLEAEKYVLKYERRRLAKYPDLTKSIVHVSESDVGAGYDIASFEGDDSRDGHSIRYIEVKAVKLPQTRFFWSQNEIYTSSILGTRYFLYLVPTNHHGTFDSSNLKIIQDPYRTVFQNKEAWLRKIESYSFSNNE